MIKYAVLIISCLFIVGPALAGEEPETADWIIYLAIGPEDARIVSQMKYDVAQYDYPKYVGYIYTKNSKKIEWYTDVKFAEKFMKSLAKRLKENGLYYFTEHHSTLLEGDRRDAWGLDDQAFFDAAVQLIPTYNYFRPIRFERNAHIDKDWRPVFPVQVRIDGPVENETGGASEALMAAEDKIKYNDFRPVNWDWTKNSHYIPPSNPKN